VASKHFTIPKKKAERKFICIRNHTMVNQSAQLTLSGYTGFGRGWGFSPVH